MKKNNPIINDVPIKASYVALYILLLQNKNTTNLKRTFFFFYFEPVICLCRR